MVNLPVPGFCYGLWLHVRGVNCFKDECSATKLEEGKGVQEFSTAFYSNFVCRQLQL